MTLGARRIAVAIGALSLLGSAARDATAQMPVGSVTVALAVDSAFAQFSRYLVAKGAKITASDPTTHQLSAMVKGSDERLTFGFARAGDSTTIAVQAQRGGMAATIMGMSTISEWLDSVRKPGKDTTSHQR